jgi:hypothetical protein
VLAELSADGQAVIGLDRDRAMLRWARPLTQRADRTVNLVQGDLLAYHFASPFSAVVLACNVLAGLDDTQARTCLACAAAHLAADGVLGIDLPSTRDGHFPTRPSPEPIGEFLEIETGHPVQVSAFQLSDPGRGSVDVEWRYDELLPDGRVERYERRERMFLRGPERMVDLLRDAGFRALHFYGDYARGPLSNRSTKFVVRASRG